VVELLNTVLLNKLLQGEVLLVKQEVLVVLVLGAGVLKVQGVRALLKELLGEVPQVVLLQAV
jgi:hypothetical protein